MMKRIITKNIDKLFKTKIPLGWQLYLNEELVDGKKYMVIKISDADDQELAVAKFSHEHAAYFDSQIRDYLFIDVVKMHPVNPLGIVHQIIEQQAELYAAELGLQDLEWIVGDLPKNQTEQIIMRDVLHYRDTIRQMYVDLTVDQGEKKPKFMKLREERRKSHNKEELKRRVALAIDSIKKAHARLVNLP